MKIQTYKYGKLIAIVTRLSDQKHLYEVDLVGMGDGLTVNLEAQTHKEAANQVIEDLFFASEHPQIFFNRRKIGAEQSGATGHDLQRMIDLANEAVSYADRNREQLEVSVRAIDRGNTQKLGGPQ
jgi:hypothetical protein